MAGRPPYEDPFIASCNESCMEGDLWRLRIESHNRKLWLHFQTTATSLTHLYKCKGKSADAPHHDESWAAFQSAASSLTLFYRDSVELLSSVYDLAKSQHQLHQHEHHHQRKIYPSDFSKWSAASVGVTCASAASATAASALTGASNVMSGASNHFLDGAQMSFLSSNANNVPPSNNDSSVNSVSSRLKRSWSPSTFFDFGKHDKADEDEEDEMDEMDEKDVFPKKRKRY